MNKKLPLNLEVVSNNQKLTNQSLKTVFDEIKQKLKENGVSSIQLHYSIENPHDYVSKLFKQLEADESIKPKKESFSESYFDSEDNSLMLNDLWFSKRVYFSRINLREASSCAKLLSLKVGTKDKSGIFVQEKTNQDVTNLFNELKINPDSMFPKELVSYDVLRLSLLDVEGKYSLYLDQVTILNNRFFFVIGCSCVAQFADEFASQIEAVQKKFNLPNVKEVTHSKVFLSLFLTGCEEFAMVWAKSYPGQLFKMPPIFRKPIITPANFKDVNLGVFAWINEDETDEDQEADEDEDEDEQEDD